MSLKKVVAISVLTCFTADGQTKAPAAPAASVGPAARATSPVDDVIQLWKGGMPESVIVKGLRTQNKAVNLAPADLVKLQNAKEFASALVEGE